MLILFRFFVNHRPCSAWSCLEKGFNLSQQQHKVTGQLLPSSRHTGYTAYAQYTQQKGPVSQRAAFEQNLKAVFITLVSAARAAAGRAGRPAAERFVAVVV
jgi:hypothetical protein